MTLIKSGRWVWAAVVLALLVLVWAGDAVNGTHNFSMLTYKIALLYTAAYAGFWFDRIIFPYSRPDEVQVSRQQSAEYRRAITVAASMIAAGLAL